MVTSVLAPGTFAAPQRAAAGFLQAEPPLQRSQHVRRALQLQPQQAGNAGRRRAEHLRAPHQHRGAHRRVRHARCVTQLRLEQGERGAVPLHLRRGRLLFAAHGAERRRVAHARFQHRAGHGHLHRRRQPGDQSGLPAEPGGEARAVGGSLLGGRRDRTSSRPASTSSDRGGSSPSSTTSPAPTRSRRARSIPFNANDPATFPSSITQTFGSSGLNFNDAMAGVFAQDDWEVRRGLTLNLGVRWDMDTLFQGDNNNFAPRAGFAWNVGGSAQDRHPRQHRHLLRHARVVGDQPRVEHRAGRADDDRPAAGRPAVSDLPHPLQRVPDRRRRRSRARRCTCRSSRATISRSASATTFQRTAPYFFNTNRRRPARARAELGGVGRLRARLRLRPAGDVGHQRAAVLRARTGADAHRGAGERAAAARRPEPHRRTATTSRSPDSAACTCSSTAGTPNTTR